ncbi:unnamed protein product [Cuscuta epithymum]|uniref:Uncharacterized protein n=1 Tax=Cuscuta epithymum TaxID=186058 RepID=A0AAV0CWQ3_9ASTE|nr:unnamed protein product [Cuscuta epithymum]CAH9143946.1 unnamed protein product [Cuscuta epithymum]
MKHSSIFRTICHCTRDVKLLSRHKPTPVYFLTQQLSGGPSFFIHNRYFSGENPNPNSPIPQPNSEQLDAVSSLAPDLSNEALKKKIERLVEGDGEAIPEIFEAILKRKLSGKSDEEDEELMKYIRSNPKPDRESHFDCSDEEFDYSSEEDDELH